MAKPQTKEDIEKDLQEDIEKLDKEVADPTIETFEEKEEEEELKAEDESEKEEKVEEETEEEVEEKEEESQEEPEEEEPLKKKLSASARENQKILAKNRKINQAINDLSGVPDPTEEELQEEFNDWDVMSDSERKIAKDSIINRKWRENISQAQKEVDKIAKWGEEVDKFIEDPKILADNPQLDGKQEDFKLFATAEENNSVPFPILVKAFLFDQQTKKVEHKGQQLPTGQGGDKEKPVRSDGKISFEEGEKLKSSNYKKYEDLLRQDKIADPEL